MNRFSQFSNKHFRRIVIAGLTVFATIAFVNYTFYEQGTQKNSSAAVPSQVMSVTFDPQIVNQNTGEFTTTIQGAITESQGVYVQGYSMFLRFDRTKMSFKSITYRSGRVVQGLGDTDAMKDFVNARGIIYLVGEYPSAVGQLFTATPQDIATVTFQLINSQANQIDLHPDYVNEFYKVNTDNRLSRINIAFSSLSVNQPIVPTSATTTPGAGTGTPAVTCTPRPPCIDATGSQRCLISEPAGGWCPNATPTCDPRVANPIGCTPGGTGNTTLDLKLRYQGIVKAPVASGSSMLVKVGVVQPDLQNIIYQTGTFTADAQGVWSGKVNFNLPADLAARAPQTNYKLLIKGPKHMQKRICDPAPRESQAGTYRCEFGKITIASGTNKMDLSGIYLSAGDLPTQDGIVDSVDIAKVRQNIGKTDAEALRVADVNLDGVVDAQDYALIIAALSIRTDEGDSTGGAVNN